MTGGAVAALASICATRARSVSYVAVTSIPGLTTVIRRAAWSSADEAPGTGPAAGWTRIASVVPSRPLGQSWFCPGSPR